MRNNHTLSRTPLVKALLRDSEQGEYRETTALRKTKINLDQNKRDVFPILSLS